MAKELNQTLDENFEVIQPKVKARKTTRKSLWLKTLTNKDYELFKKMGYSDSQAISYQKGTYGQALLFGFIGIVAGKIVFNSIQF